jgi:uncharacterized protein with NRDE domain
MSSTEANDHWKAREIFAEAAEAIRVSFPAEHYDVHVQTSIRTISITSKRYGTRLLLMAQHV